MSTKLIASLLMGTALAGAALIGFNLPGLPLIAPATAGLTQPALTNLDPNHMIFVPNRYSADVAIIDSQTNSLLGRIDVGNVPHQVAVSKQTGKLIASNTSDDTITIVDLQTMRHAGTITLDHEPEHLELSPNGETVVVGNIGAGTVSIVSLQTNEEIARVDGLIEPHNMTFSPDGTLLYVSNLGADFVSVVDMQKAAVINEISIGTPQTLASTGQASADFQGVINVTATPDGKLGFAAFGEGDVMAVIDLETQSLIRELPTGDLPWRAYTTADGRYMITPNNGDQTISILDVATLNEVARLPGGEDMTGVNTGWFESTAFVLSRGDHKITTIDLDTLEVTGEIPLGGTPETGVTTPDGSKLFVALSSTGEVVVIDTRTRTIIERIADVGDEPWGAHMAGALNYCH